MDVQYGSDAPCLRDSSAGRIGGIRIEEFTDGPDSIGLDVLFKPFEDLLGLGQEGISVDVEAGLDVELQEPGPNGTVLSCEIALFGRTLLRTLVEGVAG